MVATTDPSVFLPPTSNDVNDHGSGLSRARLYLHLPNLVHGQFSSTGSDGEDSTPTSRMTDSLTPTQQNNRLRSVSNSDTSSLRSYPSLPSLDSDNGTEGGVMAIASPVSVSKLSTRQPPVGLHPWEWELSRGGFLPSPLPSPNIQEEPARKSTRSPPSGNGIEPGSKTDAFFSTSFKNSLPTPPRPLKSTIITKDEQTSPTVSAFAFSCQSSQRQPRSPLYDSLGFPRLPSEESSLARARSLGESSKAVRQRPRGSTLGQGDRSNAFFNTSFVAYPPGMVEGFPTPTMTRTSTLTAPHGESGEDTRRFPSNLDRHPMRAVSTPVKVDVVGEDEVDKRRMVRERSNNHLPTRKNRNSVVSMLETVQPGEVMVPEGMEEEDAVSAWRVDSILGQGAFSTVWSGREVRRLKGKGRAEDWVDEGGEVAMKIMDKRICRDNDRTRISFVREVEVLKRISHPQVVNYLSSFSTSTHHCLVLEKVCGGELFELMQRPGHHARMGEDFVRRLFGELARGVGWLHEVGVVHRDLKLENILFTMNPFDLPFSPDGKIPIDRLPAFPRPLIKLTDFGLSRFIDLEHPLLQTRCGSESFAAPEIVMGQPYDGRMTDSWACGVTLYALLTGELPFDRSSQMYLAVDGESEGERRRRMMRIAKGQYGWPNGNYSRGSQEVVASLLQRDPSNRTRVGKALWEEHSWMSGSGGVPAPREDVTMDGEVVGRPGRRVLDGWLLDHGEGSVAREETV